MNKKQVLRIVVFLLLMFLVLVPLCDLFEYQNSNMSRRYEKYKVLEDDTIDAVFIGTSGVDRYFINSKAYEEYGMTVYPLSTEGEPPWLVLNMVKEAYAHQNPKLVMIDARPFIASNFAKNTNLTDVRARRVIDMLDFFSFNRLDAIKRTLDVMSTLDESIHWYTPSYYFSFIRYHNKWSDDDFSFDDMTTERAGYMGFYVAKSKSIKQTKIKASEYTDETAPLNEISEKYLRELCAYFRDNKINALFVDTPTYTGLEESKRRNTFTQIVEEEGFKFVNYNTPELDAELGLDRTSDFYNSAHVNYYGAEKFTAHFAAYLHENYDLPDHRNDEKCAKDWNGIYAKVKRNIAKFEKEAKKK
ncbi:MAG: hypothetical protein MJ131_01735 [Lachnospiraceae bacterium]|nr:hypothetical protein [Lachnospiraceae bacterium]